MVETVRLSDSTVAWRFCLLVAGWLAISSEARAVEPSTISIRWDTNSNRLAVEVIGIPEKELQHLQSTNWPSQNWPLLFSVYASQDDFIADMNVPAVSGSYTIQGLILRFQSKFPLTRGLKYRAVFRSERLPIVDNHDPVAGQVVSTFSPPAARHERTTVVTHVYPSGAVLPENLLKFYVHFSAPMQGGHIYNHIHLRDDTGQLVELPFLEIDEELWNPAMTRLTLFIDPGRIKRGVKPLEDIGPALEEGKHYTLEIGADWLDSNGMPLRQSFTKRFRVGPADREPPALATWKISPPKAGSRDTLTVAFPEPMDQALALRVIRVVNPSGISVDGTNTLSDCERLWTFVPNKPWATGQHQLQVQNTIEDLAGNNIGKVFEVDLFEGVQRRFTNTVVKLGFEVQ